MPVRIWPDDLVQTVAFELPQLPGDVFKIVIPELVSDTEQAIVPWSQVVPEWNLSEDAARWRTEIPGTVRMYAEVLFQGEEISTSVTVTNLSQRVWESVTAFTCFATYASPSFDDPELIRTYLPVGGGWKSLAELFAEHAPGDGPYTFFPVRGGPSLDDLWIYRQIRQSHPQIAHKSCLAVSSRDGRWVAGMSTPTPAFLFNNRRERCIHADPLLGTVAPGETAQGFSTIYIAAGTPEDLLARCDRD